MKKKIMAASFLIAAGYASFASAHTQSGSLIATPATDVYAVTCSDDGSGPPASLYLHVKDLAPVLAPLVSTQATKGTASSTLSTDPVDGDANYSPAVTVTGGAGVYLLKVNKSAVAGTETYTAEFHCQTAAGVHTGTTWAMTQNQ
jgi:hypothetical protein